MSESSSIKRIQKMPIDRLSAMPNHILSHILSFLELKDAANTCILSKRWQFLWYDFPRLVFRNRSDEEKDIRRFVSKVHRTLVICGRNNLDRFEVDSCYLHRFECDVNVWIDFAVRNKVKNIHLRLNGVNGYSDSDFEYHMLPQMMYSNPSLTSLLIRGCIFAPRRKIEWQSLTELHIEEMELGEQVIRKIFSGCPVLRSLYLERCWGFNRLEINSESVYELVIEIDRYGYGYEGYGSLLEIRAPFLQCLRIWWDPDETKVRLVNMASLVRANVGFTCINQDAYVKMMEVYENIAHVKELVLNRPCFKALAMMVGNGFHLRLSKHVCLRVDDLFDDEMNIAEIMGLLESAPNLETLIVTTRGFSSRKVIAWRPPGRDDLDRDLLHLKTVSITDSGMPYFDTALVLNLARILLKRATVLEKMEIVLVNYAHSNDVVMINQALNAYPRSSAKAVVVVRWKH